MTRSLLTGGREREWLRNTRLSRPHHVSLLEEADVLNGENSKTDDKTDDETVERIAE